MAISKEYLEKRTELIDEILATRTDVVKAIWTTLVATNDELKSHIALYDTLDTINSSVIYTQDEKIKLAGIEDGAQVNKIEKIFYNGTELKINTADKSVSFEAEKLNDAGSGLNPIYIKDGKAAASTDSAGGGLNPIFLNNGVLTASTDSAGDINHGVYLENGVFKATTEARLNDAGSGLNPIYIKDGKAVASNSHVGDETRLIYLKNGTLTASTAHIGSDTGLIYLKEGALTASKMHIGAEDKPIYLCNGELVASTATIGSTTQPIYLNSGELMASLSTIGSALNPIYLNNGILTASAASVGDKTHGVYLENGEFKVTDGTTLDNAGSGINPIYTTGGKITASTSSVGDADTPIYMKSGVLTATTSTIGNTKKPIWMNGGNLTTLSETIGSGVKPIYLNAGELTASTSTIGSATKPIYLNAGTLTASNSTAGSGTQPIYLNSGTLTASTSSVGDADTPIYMKSGVLTAGNKLAPFSKTYNATDYSTFALLMKQIVTDGVAIAYVNCNNFTDWETASTYTYNDLRNILREIRFYGSSNTASTAKPSSTLYVGGTYSSGSGSGFGAMHTVQLTIAVNAFNLCLNIISTGCCILELNKASRFTGIIQSQWGNATGGNHSGSSTGMTIIRYVAIYSYMTAQMAGTFLFERIGETRFVTTSSDKTHSLQITPYNFTDLAEKAQTLYVGNNASFSDIRNVGSVEFTIQPVKGAQIFVPTTNGWTAGQAVNTWTSYGVIWQY